MKEISNIEQGMMNDEGRGGNIEYRTRNDE
jgi:hypothetical protein